MQDLEVLRTHFQRLAAQRRAELGRERRRLPLVLLLHAERELLLATEELLQLPLLRGRQLVVLGPTHVRARVRPV